MVYNEYQNIKLCDFGSCLRVEELPTNTDEFVARYYRAPEIILGVPFDGSVDIWAAATTLFELYTGTVMFAGSSNNEILKTIMTTKG